ncbi:MAG: PEP-CTERM sorting domain-containing protein [Phycisphaerales bacterium]
MNKIALIAGLAAATTASADTLLNIDLGTTNQITITATNAASSASVTGSDTTGVLLADFYNTAVVAGLLETLVAGDLTTAGQASDGTPNLFTGIGSFGLNFWSWTNDDAEFIAGSTAFSGSATWDVSGAEYADLLAGNSFGDIYAFADTDDDIAAGAVVIGQWNVVPAPSSAALLGLGGLVVARRRRA